MHRLDEPLPFPHPEPGSLDADGILNAFAHRMMYSVGKDEHTATPLDVYEALAYAVRDRVMERWFQTQDAYYRHDAKRVYYLSLEYLTGRFLLHDIMALGAYDAAKAAMRRIGYELTDLLEQEWDPGLGNGGLGRLAACLLDSAAALSYPVYGYGLRYEYGIFRQRIHDGFQQEAPDNWLRYGSPWEIPRPDALFPVMFRGRSTSYRDDEGRERWDWTDAETIWAMAYDMPVIGYRSGTVNSLRLWAAKSSREFDLSTFNSGNYVQAVEAKNQTETLTRVLYPSSEKDVGKELRLKQQYFFVSATLQDVLRRFLKKPGRRIEELPEKVAIQLNDTHPALAIPELMRILLDDRMLPWEHAWELTVRTCGYTNHTVLPEALETWSVPLFRSLLPRHFAIVEEIDGRLRRYVRGRTGDPAAEERAAIVDRSGEGAVRMANLSIVGSHATNGVARIHSEILVKDVFPTFAALYPSRFRNVTNGITPRRWLLQANPRLASLVTEAIGDAWVRDLAELEKLAPFAEDAPFLERWDAVKRANKADLAAWLRERHGIRVDPAALCDVQVKRMHEYKRQLLNVLHVLALWGRLRDGADEAPRTVLFAGKAAPSYVMAKLVIKLIHAVSDAIRKDPKAAERLKVVFVPNYCVSAAERIFPACELSEQVSTAGTEASGTGNMKAALNGGITIGTLDGANVEIAEAVGAESIFVFGRTVEEIAALRRDHYDPRSFIAADHELSRAVEAIASGALDDGAPGLFRPVVDVLLHFDRYFHAADFGSYVAAQSRAAAAWREGRFPAMSVRNVAGCGRFSSDRTLRQYAEEIWEASPVPVRPARLVVPYP